MFSVCVLFAVVLPLSLAGSHIHVQYIQDPQVKILPPPIRVFTYASTHAPSSSDWLDIVDNVKPEFPEMQFETQWLTPGDLPEGKTVGLPYTEYIRDDREYVFNEPMEERFLRRWLIDAKFGFKSSYVNVSVFDKRVSEAFPLYVHILSSLKPESHLPQTFPEIGFVWSKINQTRYFNTVLVRDIFGRLHQKNNFTEQELFHTLLPPIIPNWLLDNPVAMRIYQKMSIRDIHIVYDGNLDPWWGELARKHRETAFIHLRTNETNSTSPSVWFKRRRVVFMVDSLEKDVVESWLLGIIMHTTEPWFRPSNEPEEPHERIVDITGDSFWEWRSKNSNAILSLHNGTNSFDLDYYYDGLTEAGYSVGQMDMNKNDHEGLPPTARNGMCLEYSAGSLEQMKKCNDFAMPGTHKVKTEM